MSEMNATVQRSSATEPLRQTFHANPSRGDEPRDAARAVVRVVVAEMDSAVTIEGYKLRTGEHFLEVYEDRLPAIEKLVRTKEHDEAEALARRLSKTKQEQWIEERIEGFNGTATERAVFRERLAKECPHHWAQELVGLGKRFRAGLPVLMSMEVVRRIGPPITPENAARNANQELADVIANAIRQASGGRERAEQNDRKPR